MSNADSVAAIGAAIIGTVVVSVFVMLAPVLLPEVPRAYRFIPWVLAVILAAEGAAFAYFIVN